MNIPPRPSKGSPPRRAALHERSDSHTNERVSPTLRVIGDPQARIHASSPFPTKPSQILLPKGHNGQGSTFGPGVGASNSGHQYSVIENNYEDPLNMATSSPQQQSGIAGTKDAFVPNDGNTPGPDIGTSFPRMDEGTEDNTSRLSDDIVQLPSVSPGFQSSELYGTAHQNHSLRQPASKDSDGSLSSSNSTGTVIVKRNRDGVKHASYSAFPITARPSSSKSDLSLSNPQKAVTSDAQRRDAPVSPISPSSPVSPDNALPQEGRISSVPLYANLHPSSQNSVNLQYPVIRPPSASASWYVQFCSCCFFGWSSYVVRKNILS